MAEGKTNMFGKAYNTIGSTDSNFIIKTKGDLKVQWGNKYIDVIKNGKIASEGSKILFVVNSPEEVKQNGVYIVTSTEGNELWVCIDGIKIQIANTSEETTYVSFLVEQKATAEQKHQALTNIGFYYETLSEAKAADIISGIIYVENDNKLYIAKNGTLTEYLVTTSNTPVIEETQEIKKHPLYIQDYSLWVDGIEYIRCTGDVVQVLKQLTVHQMFQSVNATEEKGFRLYINDQDSILEIDRIIWRKYPNPITYGELQKMIETKTLSPKMYYLLTDFQNPWEVSWDDEPMYYEDQYTEINEVKHLSGLRNAMQIIVQAVNWDNIDKQVWSPLHPEWIIHYDHTFKGPEHKITVDGVEQTYYGYRTRTDSEGKVIYLPCRGQITYLKDEFGNEGNFNFRQFMFKRDGNWRYIMDYSTEILGKFFEGTNNKFNINIVDTYIQVFKFTENKDTDGNTISYTMSNVDADKHIIQGHNLVIQVVETSIVKENSITLEKVEETKLHNITASIEGNTISGIKGLINITAEAKNNIIRNIEGDLTIQIIAKGNDISNIKDKVIIQGSEFNENKLSYFSEWLFNSSVFNNNTVNSCVGKISNQGTMINNILIRVNSLTNTNILSNNNIDNVENLTNNEIISANTIKEITGGLTVNSTMNNNNINTIKGLTVNSAFNSNIINYVDNLNIQADIVNNIINDFKDCNNQGAIENNSFKDLINNSFYGIVQDNKAEGNIQNSSLQAFTNNKIYKDITELDATGVTDSCIFNRTISQLSAADLYYCTFNYIAGLTLDKPVYYTTFHGSIGNVSRQLTDYEWELLQDPSKKTDAYPNIRVVCVPEIIKKGMILMWYGQEEIPKGWAVCDGSNGTPDLRKRFIKQVDTDGKGNPTESVGEVNPEGIEWDENNTGILKLKAENLPEHHHPHKKHKHYFEGSGSGTITDDYASYNGSYTINKGEGGSTTSGEDWGPSNETETISINVSGYTSEEISEEDEWQYGEVQPIKIEPKHYKLIFIMKIDENPQQG